MHYIHYLTYRQKRLTVVLFIVLPIVILGLLMALWAHRQGMFKKVFSLKSTVRSARGITTQTPVTFSGIAIGNVSNVALQGPDAIVLTLQIGMEYRPLIKKDSVATVAAENIIGLREVRIRGGTKDSRAVHDGDFLPSAEMMDMETTMDRLTPIINAAERIVLRADQMISAFPNDRLNSSVNDLAGILSDIREGKGSVGKMVSTDNGELYRKIDRLVTKLNDISVKVDEASKHLPETMENVAGITRSVKTAGNDLPEMQKTLHRVLKNLDRVLNDVAAMTPDIRKTVESAGAMAQDASKITPRLPALMDDVELTLSETMVMIQSLKSSWPMKNLVPKEKKRDPFEPGLRQSPYAVPPK